MDTKIVGFLRSRARVSRIASGRGGAVALEGLRVFEAGFDYLDVQKARAFNEGDGGQLRQE
jgi:hypothetical protein